MAKWSEANCMGYALGINEWLLVPWWRDSSVKECAEWLADTYNLKIVKKRDMKPGKEYIVFRKSSVDFHFARRSADGHWRHKPGWSYVRPMKEKEVFASYWSNPSGTCWYNSTPVIFEVQE